MFVVSMQSPEGAEAKDATKVTKHEVIQIHFFFKSKTANSTVVEIIFYAHFGLIDVPNTIKVTYLVIYMI